MFVYERFSVKGFRWDILVLWLGGRSRRFVRISETLVSSYLHTVMQKCGGPGSVFLKFTPG